MALEKLSVQNARELVNYLITEVIRHARCAVELQKRLVPHAVGQVKLVYTSLRRSINWLSPAFCCPSIGEAEVKRQGLKEHVPIVINHLMYIFPKRQ